MLEVKRYHRKRRQVRIGNMDQYGTRASHEGIALESIAIKDLQSRVSGQ